MTPIEVALLLDAMRTMLVAGQLDQLEHYLDRSIDALERAPVTTEQVAPVQSQSKDAIRMRITRALKRTETNAVRTRSNVVRDVSLELSSFSDSDLLSDSKEIQEKEGEHERESGVMQVERVRTERERVRAERPPPEDTPQAEIDAWCEARGLPVGHPAMPYFLAEQSNAKPKRSWKRTWARHVERLTLLVQEEAAKRARLNGNVPVERPPIRQLTQTEIESRIASANRILGRS